MADIYGTRSPFARVFNPDNKRTLTGLFGRVIGVPSGEERTGAARGKALEIFSNLRAKGMNSQKALLELMKTPEGSDLFTNDPNLLSTITGFAKQTAEPKPTLTNVSPGGQLYSTNPAGDTSLVGQNPPTDIQTFNTLAEYAKLDPETKAKIAELQLYRKGQAAGAKERALNELQQQGKISHDLGLKILGGVYRNIHIYNDAGEVVGQTVMDTSTGTAINAPEQAGQGQAPEALPSQAPNQAPQAQSTMPSQTPQALPTDDQTFLADPKKSMYLAAGIAPYVVTTGGGLIGQLTDPSLEQYMSGEFPARYAALQQHRAALTSLARLGEGMNIPARLLSEVQHLSNFGTATSPSVSPMQAVGQHLQLRKTLENEIAADTLTYQDKRLPRKVRIQAEQRVVAYDKVLRTIPEEGDLVHLMKLIKSGKSGALYPSALIQKGKEAFTDITSGKTPEVTPGETPNATISQMDISTLQTLDVKKLSTNDLRAYIARLNELQGK